MTTSEELAPLRQSADCHLSLKGEAWEGEIASFGYPSCFKPRLQGEVATLVDGEVRRH